MLRRLAWVLVLAGCATSQQGAPTQFSMADQPDAGRVELRYRNTGAYTVCLDPSSWPSTAGYLDGAARTVHLVVDGREYPIEDTNMGYCPWVSCSTQVRPGGESVRHIPYERFNLPTSLYREPKQLTLPLTPWRCRLN